jgi:hypothetical protein
MKSVKQKGLGKGKSLLKYLHGKFWLKPLFVPSLPSHKWDGNELLSYFKRDQSLNHCRWASANG